MENVIEKQTALQNTDPNYLQSVSPLLDLIFCCVHQVYLLRLFIDLDSVWPPWCISLFITAFHFGFQQATQTNVAPGGINKVCIFRCDWTAIIQSASKHLTWRYYVSIGCNILYTQSPSVLQTAQHPIQRCFFFFLFPIIIITWKNNYRLMKCDLVFFFMRVKREIIPTDPLQWCYVTCHSTQCCSPSGDGSSG